MQRGTSTPHPNETVLVFKTLDRYIQNAGGDPGSQIRTPVPPETPTPPTPVPTSASGPLGNLSWSGEGTFVTEPFGLTAGGIYVQVNAGVLTMVQLRDAAGTAIGIATAGPQPSNTTMQVPMAGTYRLEVWPFGAGPWTVTISYVSSPTAAPTLAPATVHDGGPGRKRHDGGPDDGRPDHDRESDHGNDRGADDRDPDTGTAEYLWHQRHTGRRPST